MNKNASTRERLFRRIRAFLDWASLHPEVRLPNHEKISEEKDVKKFVPYKDKLEGDQLKEVIAYLGKLSLSEGDREKQIESKALSLIGFTGLVSTFVIAFLQLWRDSSSISPEPRNLIGFLYVGIGLSLLLTVRLAIQAVKVGKYPFMFPNEADLYKLTESDRDRIYQEHAYDLVKSYVFNHKLINAKARYVSGAQIWFRNTIFLLLFLLLFFGIQFLSPPQNPVLPSMVIMTATPIPTATQIPSASATSVTVTISFTPVPSTPSSTPPPTSP